MQFLRQRAGIPICSPFKLIRFYDLFRDGTGDRYRSYGEEVSNVGHVAGTSRGELAFEAFHWTPNTGMIGLGDLPGGRYYSEGHGINDLDQVVGFSRSDSGNGDDQEAFLWDPANGMVGLGDLPGGYWVSIANDINNASEVIGWSSSALRAGGEAFIWDPENGMRGLGTFQGGLFAVDAYAINELGQVSGIAANGESFLWDPQDGMITLGVLEGELPNTHGLNLNELGQVVGWALDLYYVTQDAFVWDAEHGIRNLQDLVAAGTDPDYADFMWASGINNAGQIVALTWIGEHGALLTPFVLADLNCDDVVDTYDLAALWLLVFRPERYEQAHPGCPGQWAGDINQDAAVDVADWVALADYIGSGPAGPGQDITPAKVSILP